MKIVIIGGVAGGATAAARLRRLNENHEIIILERSNYISYANCGLPYYIGGVIKDKSNLTLQTPQSFHDRFNIDVRVRNEAVRIDTGNKIVRVKRLEDNTEYDLPYDKLVYAPGAKPIKPDIDGIDDNRIMTLRTVEDTYRISDYVKTKNPRHAVIIGGGFIGLEMAENLINLGVKTTLLQRSAQVMPPLDYDMASMLHAYIRQNGVDLKLNSPVKSFAPNEEYITITLKNGKELKADLILSAIGVMPETTLAKQAGLKLGIKDSVEVDEHMLTSDPNIYAVGDCVQIRNSITKALSVIPLAGPANKQGRIAADNICGIKSEYKGSASCTIVKLFDMNIATAGINEKTAKQTGIDYEKVVTYSASHATYYPNATNMTVKTIFDKKTGRILGAQIIGETGVDKRIDVLASAIQADKDAQFLTNLDLAYAPPFSSAKDPVNMAGYVIENIQRSLVKQHHWHDISSVMKDKQAVLIDVRTREEFETAHIKGAVNIPLNDLRDNIDKLDKEKKYYVNCHSGLRSYIACRILSQHGFYCSNLSGGHRFYQAVMSDYNSSEDKTHPLGL